MGGSPHELHEDANVSGPVLAMPRCLLPPLQDNFWLDPRVGPLAPAVVPRTITGAAIVTGEWVKTTILTVARSAGHLQVLMLHLGVTCHEITCGGEHLGGEGVRRAGPDREWGDVISCRGSLRRRWHPPTGKPPLLHPWGGHDRVDHPVTCGRALSPPTFAPSLMCGGGGGRPCTTTAPLLG